MMMMMMTLVDMMQAFKGSPISLDEPWLIDLSHLLLVISASCNVVIYTAQVGRKQKTAQVGRQKLKSRHWTTLEMPVTGHRALTTTGMFPCLHISQNERSKYGLSGEPCSSICSWTFWLHTCDIRSASVEDLLSAALWWCLQSHRPPGCEVSKSTCIRSQKTPATLSEKYWQVIFCI